jgi:curved DNA-binding protein CbpA
MLVQQSEILSQLEAQGAIDPGTLANAQAALEHDLAYYALSDADEQALYDQILKDYSEQGQPIPSFEALQLEITPEAKAAAQFILDLLAGK